MINYQATQTMDRYTKLQSTGIGVTPCLNKTHLRCAQSEYDLKLPPQRRKAKEKSKSLCREKTENVEVRNDLKLTLDEVVVY